MSYAIKKKLVIVCDEFIKSEKTHVFECIDNNFLAKGFNSSIEIFSPTIKENGFDSYNFHCICLLFYLLDFTVYWPIE